MGTNPNIIKLQLEQIEAAATELKYMIECAENVSVPPLNKLAYLRNIYEPYKNLLHIVNECASGIEVKSLQGKEMLLLHSINTAQYAAERYERAVKDVENFLKCAGYEITPIVLDCEPNPGKKAGRPPANTGKRLKDFLKCDENEIKRIVTAIRNDNNKLKGGYFGKLIIALKEKGLISENDICKELYEAIRNDFPEAPRADTIRKIAPQQEHIINNNANKYRKDIDAIKAIL